MNVVDPAIAGLLRDLEERLLQVEVRSSRDELDALIDDGFIEIGASGRTFDKRSIMETLVAEIAEATPVLRTLDDFNTTLIAPGVVLATYRAIRHSEPPVESLRSSIWRQRGDRWQILFHQGTPAAAE